MKQHCQNKQDNFLANKKAKGSNTSIYLINGIHLQGVIEDYDKEVIFLRCQVTQMVYKQAIATIL